MLHKGKVMKKVRETPIQDKIYKSTIKAMFIVIDDCMEIIREAEKEKIIASNNNYYVYKMNYDYIKKIVKFLDNDYVYGLLNDKDKAHLRNVLNELNTLSVHFNVNIKQFNDSEKTQPLFYRAHLKPLASIAVKHFANER